MIMMMIMIKAMMMMMRIMMIMIMIKAMMMMMRIMIMKMKIIMIMMMMLMMVMMMMIVMMSMVCIQSDSGQCKSSQVEPRETERGFQSICSGCIVGNVAYNFSETYQSQRSTQRKIPLLFFLFCSVRPFY